MISDAARRLAAACEDLRRFGNGNSLTETPGYGDAAAQLEEAARVLIK